MTLSAFSPAALDALALRMLDVAATVRTMSQIARENQVSDFQMHGSKAIEWLERIEQWSIEGKARLETQIIRERGARRGRGASPPAHETPPKRPRVAAKK